MVADRVASRALGDLRGLQRGQHKNKHEKVLNLNLKLLATNLSYLRAANSKYDNVVRGSHSELRLPVVKAGYVLRTSTLWRKVDSRLNSHPR